MTTIAYRGRVMAADTLCIRYGARAKAVKILRKPYGLVGMAGKITDCMRLIEWYEGDRRGKPDFTVFGDEEPSATLLIARYDGAVEYVNRYASIEDVAEEFIAIGSGSEAAMGAMHHGAGPEYAVEIASRIDVNTGSEIQAESLDPPR